MDPADGLEELDLTLEQDVEAGAGLADDDLFLGEDADPADAPLGNADDGEPELDLEELSLLDEEPMESGRDGDAGDQDIDEILKESRAFWEQKKE
jgi:hypothetical protein